MYWSFEFACIGAIEYRHTKLARSLLRREKILYFRMNHLSARAASKIFLVLLKSLEFTVILPKNPKSDKMKLSIMIKIWKSKIQKII